MAPEQRRESILDAVIPLIFEHGPSVTSKQIAEAACVGEGTLFRAFDDKESIVSAAIEKYFDPDGFRNRLAHISRELPLERKLLEIVRTLRERFSGVVRLAGLVGDPRSSHQREHRHVYAEIIAEVLAPDAERLNVPPERIAHLVRMMAFAAAIPAFNTGNEFTDDELTQLMLYGVVGQHPEVQS